jgi:hypothetical protein
VTKETKIRQELATYLQDLPAEKVKTAVIKWLGTGTEDIADLRQNLSLEIESNEPQMIYGSIDSNLNFSPLTEEEMISQSLEALNEYQQSGQGVSQQAMSEWADSLGTDDELSCPR